MSVRILEGAGLGPGIRRLEPIETPAIARIPAEIVAARAEAAAIVAAAEAEAAAVRARAHAEGLEAARAEAAALLLAARADEARRPERLTELVSSAAAAVAERLLGDALAHDDVALREWARRSLVAFGRARRIELRCHPATADRLSVGLAGLLPDPEAACAIVPDAAMGLHALSVSADNGEARIELGVQVASLLASLGSLLGAEVRGG